MAFENVYIKYVADEYCTVEADSEADIVKAIQDGHYTVDNTDYDDRTMEVFIMEEDGTVRKIG